MKELLFLRPFPIPPSPVPNCHPLDTGHHTAARPVRAPLPRHRQLVGHERKAGKEGNLQKWKAGKEGRKGREKGMAVDPEGRCPLREDSILDQGYSPTPGGGSRGLPPFSISTKGWTPLPLAISLPSPYHLHFTSTTFPSPPVLRDRFHLNTSLPQQHLLSI